MAHTAHLWFLPAPSSSSGAALTSGAVSERSFAVQCALVFAKVSSAHMCLVVSWSFNCTVTEAVIKAEVKQRVR
jgi:hypothetical protein